MKKFFQVVLFYCCIFQAGVSGQELPGMMTQFSVEDGLSQSTVHSIIQDVYGFIWISTGNGLNCFDGKNFSPYFPPVSARSSYNVNRIRRVLPDDIGNLWVGTDEGLYFLNRITNEMVDPFPEIKHIKKGFCYPIFLTKDTIHALIADSAVLSINIHDHQYRETHIETSLSFVLSLQDEDACVAGFSASSTLYLFSNVSGKLKVQNFQIDRQVTSYLSSIKYFSENKYLILLQDELLLFDLKSGKSESLQITGVPLNKGMGIFKTIQQLRSGDIWIGTINQGIFILDSNLKYKYQIKNEIGKEDQSPNLKSITSIYEDRDGNLWVGTDGYGLILFRQSNSGIKLLNSKSTTTGKLSSDFIWSFYEDKDNNLWIGTSGEGLNKWNRTTNIIENIYLSHKKAFPTPNDIYSISPHQQDKLLLGTSCGLWQFDKKTQSTAPLSNQFNENLIRRATTIIPLGDSRYLSQIQNKCFWVNFKEQSWSFDTIPLADTALISYTYQSKSLKLLAFSTNGFYDLSNAEIRYHPYLYLSEPMIMKVNAIAEVENEFMYAATDKGLALLDFEGNIKKIYGTAEGLPNHYLYGVLDDNYHNLWISSNRGLSHFNPKTEKFDNFGLNDGLQSLEYNGGAAYKNNSGEMFFGGINGFNYFHPDSIFSSKIFPVILISGLKVNDSEYLPDSSMMSKKVLYLLHDQNTITFEFNTIDYNNSGLINYYCFLEGSDKDWVSLGTIPSIRYSNLAPGQYKLIVKAQGRHGNWTRTSAELNVIIARPFWKKAWFLILMAGCATAIIAIVVYYLFTFKIRRKLAALKRQQEINLIHRRISSDLHDDIGTGLSKLAMQCDFAKMKSTEGSELHKILGNLSSRTRNLGDQLRVIVWTLNPQYDQLENLFAYIRQQAGDFLENSDINLRFDVPDFIPPVTITPDVKRNIYFIVMESLHNAVKHSGTREIIIVAQIDVRHLEIAIQDKGKGFDPKQLGGFGNGIHFMQKRMEDIHGHFEMNSVIGVGTTIMLSIDL